jgi:hypothetical protein
MCAGLARYARQGAPPASNSATKALIAAAIRATSRMQNTPFLVRLLTGLRAFGRATEDHHSCSCEYGGPPNGGQEDFLPTARVLSPDSHGLVVGQLPGVTQRRHQFVYGAIRIVGSMNGAVPTMGVPSCLKAGSELILRSGAATLYLVSTWVWPYSFCHSYV